MSRVSSVNIKMAAFCKIIYHHVFVVITFERFGISKEKKTPFKILDNTMHLQNLKFLA